ncbi:tRNA cytidylyltransferase [Pseudodesulfovibrio mercurii]|uniref:tRNA cytidylyltransferase n=1 Tax=Pseudodesulfovibrio mercurii TaxID=641491 RepID=F0JF74_9BACT|nr:tRNA nucleotidyltransferase [Pseudodesulfovibrio mercurii]EGB13630.1 tRNA cytidylyltransferase [Pseudodesulfovibrio mercurii]
MKVYLAGGAVRDLLLGRPIHDRDYLVMDATREEFRRAFPQAREVGRTFPVFLVDNIEFSFPRADSLDEELKARDLTVNAQLLDEHGEVIFHPQGFDDLEARILRPASSHSLADDPLRVLRAARFSAQLPDFTAHQELIEAMRAVGRCGGLAAVSADRVVPELRKALESPRPGNFLRLLAEADCLLPWFPEFEKGRTIPAGPLPYHHSDVLAHTCRVMDDLAGDPVAVWMGLTHDLGKILTPRERLPRHYGHDLAGVPLAEGAALRLRMPNEYKNAGMKAARWHMTAARYGQLRPGTRVDLLMDLHLSGTLTPLFELVRADHGEQYGDRARKELAAILPVRLAPEDRNHGAESGEKLRMLRAQVLRGGPPAGDGFDKYSTTD